MNWIEKLFCNKYGHKPKERVRKVWQMPGTRDYNVVVFKVTQERSACGRCGRGLTEWEDTVREKFQGATFPSDKWDRIRAGKVVIA